MGRTEIQEIPFKRKNHFLLPASYERFFSQNVYVLHSTALNDDLRSVFSLL